jgi:ribosomal protein S18 acetylase RimI-like enzyme
MMPAETNLYYIHVPVEVRPVSHAVDFLPLDQFLEDEEACTALWEMLHSQFKTRSKFLAIWPCVRFVAVHRDDAGVAGLLLVSAPLNWQIDYVVVRPDARGQGIATSLVHETLNQALARRVPYVMLTSRERLRPLYEGQCGFTPVAASTGVPASPHRQLALPTRNGH